MNDRLRGRHSFVNLKMKQEFAGLRAIAANQVIVEIDQGQVLDAKITFAA